MEFSGSKSGKTMTSAIVEEKPIGKYQESTLKDFLWLSLVFILIRIPWLALIPMREAPDEFAHVWVISFIKSHLCLPSYQDVIQGGPSAVYGSLPQIGYVPHILLSFLAPEPYLPLASRVAGLLIGLVTLWAAVKIGHLLFKNRFLAAALPTLVIVHPQFIFLHSYANNDATACALASLIILLILQTIENGLSFKRSLFLGLLSGLVVLSKYSSLSTFPAILVGLAVATWIHKAKISTFIYCLAIIFVTSLGVSGWWFARNYFEFNQDLLGTKTMYKTWASTFHRDLNYYLSPLKIIRELRWWRMMFFSFWGMFGYMDRYLPKPVYWTYVAFCAAAAAACLKQLLLRLKQPINYISLSKWSILALIVITNLIAMVWASTVNLGGPQGRYLLISEIPVLSLIIGGLSKLNKQAHLFVLVFIIFNCLVSIGSWMMLFAIYRNF